MPTDVIDCRSEEGITIGLIDAINTISQLLTPRDLSGSVVEALKDLKADPAFQNLLIALEVL